MPNILMITIRMQKRKAYVKHNRSVEYKLIKPLPVNYLNRANCFFGGTFICVIAVVFYSDYTCILYVSLITYDEMKFDLISSRLIYYIIFI